MSKVQSGDMVTQKFCVVTAETPKRNNIVFLANTGRALQTAKVRNKGVVGG